MSMQINIQGQSPFFVPDGTQEDEIQRMVSAKIGSPAATQTGLGQQDPALNDTLTWRQAASEAFSNIPSSTYNVAKDAVQSLRHPLQSLQAIDVLAESSLQKALPEMEEGPGFIATAAEPREEIPGQTFDSLIGHFKNRYGSVENFKKTMANDPVGALVDIGSFAVPGGGAVKTLERATGIRKLGKVGQVIQKAGAVLDPITAGKELIFTAGKRVIPKQAPTKLYQSAAKFSTVLTDKQRARLTKTALDNQITPSIRGIDKARSNINSLNNKITNLIALATDSGEKIPIKRLFRDFRELQKDAALSSTPLESQAAINNIRKQIFEANKRIGRKEFTPEQIQILKQNIYKETESYYSKISATPAKVKAQQAVARAAKESLEDIFPEIKQLNRKEGELIELNKAIQRSANRITNRDLMGIGIPLKGTTGGVVGGPVGAAAGLGLGLLDTPSVKANLAIVLDLMQKRGIKINPGGAAVRMGLVQIGKLSDMEQLEITPPEIQQPTLNQGDPFINPIDSFNGRGFPGPFNKNKRI